MPQDKATKETGKTSKPIIIVGGGIGGCACALALSQKGYASIVLEQATEFGEIGAGIQLGPNVHKMFIKLGIERDIQNIAFYPNNLIMNDAETGEEITRVDLGEDFRERFNAPYGVIHRSDLHDTIINACQKVSIIDMRTSIKIVDYKETTYGVTAIAENNETYEGTALIAADGLWSNIRSKIVGDGGPRVSGHIAYRAVLPVNEVPEPVLSDDVVLWAGPKTHLVHYKLRRGEIFNIVAVFHSDKYEEGWDAFGDPKELEEKFKNERPEVLMLLDRIESWRMWVLCDREPVKFWSRGKVTLLGDAAHPMLQYLAAGAGMAIEDSVVLAELLEANDGDSETAFKQYEKARYLRTGRVQTTARIYGDLYHAAGVVGELRTMMLSGRDPKNYDGISWLYDGI